MSNAKIGRPTKERMAMIRGLATDLLWYGRIETTLARAKELRPYTEKILTLAINSYKDTVTREITREGQTLTVKDGPKKLAARRAIMNLVYDVQEKREENEKPEEFAQRAVARHPLVEKIFDEYAPLYDKRAENTESKSRGGYTRIIKTGKRNGDNADMAIIELV